MTTVHPVSRYGYDPLPGNKGEYVWIDGEGYVPGRYTYGYNTETGLFYKTGHIRKDGK